MNTHLERYFRPVAVTRHRHHGVAIISTRERYDAAATGAAGTAADQNRGHHRAGDAEHGCDPFSAGGRRRRHPGQLLPRDPRERPVGHRDGSLCRQAAGAPSSYPARPPGPTAARQRHQRGLGHAQDGERVHPHHPARARQRRGGIRQLPPFASGGLARVTAFCWTTG